MIALILDDIRSTHNVGSIFRSADGFGVTHIYLSGYTPYPHFDSDPRLPHLANKITSQIHKTALGAELTVPFSVHSDIASAIDAATRDGFTVAALEQNPQSKPLASFTPWPKTAILVGNEVHGVSQDALTRVDQILEIPMNGAKESFNVSVATGIVLYALTAKITQ